jgi:hypothetical protein
MAEESKQDGGDLASKLLKGLDSTAADQQDNQNKISNKDLAYVFLQNRDAFPSKPYYEDGNPEMYTKENMEKRNTLRDNEVVQDAIKDFMSEFKGAAQGKVTKDEYFRVFISVGMILRPGVEADDLQKIIKEDFDNDSMDKALPGHEEDAKAMAEAEQ